MEFDISILGKKYVIVIKEIDKEYDGYIDFSTRRIYIQKDVLEREEKHPHGEDRNWLIKHVIKHEVTHAFHFESGHVELSVLNNETLVDWITHHCCGINEVSEVIFDVIKERYNV